jgi:Lrp/AsnC family transcriptional regulator for asnA, asnC and gidA
LKKDGIITGEQMQVNFQCYGYECLVDIGIKTSVDKEKEVKATLEKNRRIISTAFATGSFGRYNILSLTILPKLRDLTTVLEEISSDPNIKSLETLVSTETTLAGALYSDNLEITPFLSKNKKKAAVETRSTVKQLPEAGLKNAQIDEEDRQIVKILSQSSRTPFTQIAKQIGISTKNVMQRYKKLREGKVITNSAITVNLKKLGYNGMAFVFLKLQSRSKMQEIQEKLLQIPNQIMSTQFVGVYDLRVCIAIRDIQELLNLTKRIHEIDGIEEAQITINDLFLNSWPPPPISLLTSL